MNHNDLETVYELLATHIDHFDEATAPIFLAKLALLMATEINDVDVVSQCIKKAADQLGSA